MPLIGGTRGSPYPADGLKLMYLDSIRALGGIGGFMHPYTLNSGDVTTPAGAAQSDIPVHALLAAATSTISYPSRRTRWRARGSTITC